MHLKTRVLVVDGSDVVRAGLVALLDREDDFVVVGAATSPEAGLDALATTPADVVLLDHGLPGMRGAAACSEITRRYPGVGVVVRAPCQEDSIVHTYLRAGARGYLPDDACGAEIVAAVRAVAHGEAAVTAPVVTRLVDWARRARQVAMDDESLAPREVVTLSLVAQGMKNREIARRLGVSEAAAKLYLRSTMRKLGVNERAQAVVAGLKRGVI
jgi:DNA-binding NarL/FixJ family response regulator